jgi:hypothetical protein
VHCSNPKVREVVSARAVVPPWINCAGTRRRMRSLVQPAAGVDRSNDRGYERRKMGLSVIGAQVAESLLMLMGYHRGRRCAARRSHSEFAARDRHGHPGNLAQRGCRADQPPRLCCP